MKREILFRGKRIDNNQWVYGGISVFKGCVDIFDQNAIDNSCEQVFDYTVGQFTGLTDKNGVKIFEGDILHPSYNRLVPFVVEFNDGKYNCCNYHIPECEVIGNIHDNQ